MPYIWFLLTVHHQKLPQNILKISQMNLAHLQNISFCWHGYNLIWLTSWGMRFLFLIHYPRILLNHLMCSSQTWTSPTCRSPLSTRLVSSKPYVMTHSCFPLQGYAGWQAWGPKGCLLPTITLLNQLQSPKSWGQNDSLWRCTTVPPSKRNSSQQPYWLLQPTPTPEHPWKSYQLSCCTLMDTNG